MYTLDKNAKKVAHKRARRYLAAAAFCGIFAAIYEHFSFGVFSAAMVFSFVFPLALGALPWILIAAGRLRPASDFSRRLQMLGIGCLTTGSILTGVLEIYGSTNALIRWYWIAGSLLFAAALLFWRPRIIRAENE